MKSTLAPELAVATPRLGFAYEALVEIGETRRLGTGPAGERRIVPILGGSFAGPGLKGRVLPGGADRQLLGLDGVLRLDALYEMETEDGAVITVRNRVVLDPAASYARSTVSLTAPEGPHGWLNRKAFVGTLDSLAPAPRVLIRVYAVD